MQRGPVRQARTVGIAGLREIGPIGHHPRADRLVLLVRRAAGIAEDILHFVGMEGAIGPVWAFHVEIIDMDRRFAMGGLHLAQA
jgi:hypothetical protein